MTPKKTVRSGSSAFNTNRKVRAMTTKKEDTPQEMALQLANTIDALCKARDSMPISFVETEANKAWDGTWMALHAANDAGMVLLARERHLAGSEVRSESGHLVGTVLVSSEKGADGASVSFLCDGAEMHMLLPPGYGENRFPAEWYFARSGSDLYDWTATTELLRDFASQPLKVAA